MTVSCGGTRRASLRASQVMGANTFFRHPCTPGQPDFAHPPPPPPSEVPEPPPPYGWLEYQARSELVDPVPSPIPAYWGSFVAPWDIQRLPQPPKDPSRPWLAHACMCLYVHVSACIACICMYMYVLSVCVCIWLEEINTPKFHQVSEPQLAQWEILTHVTLETGVRVPELSKEFCWHLIPFLTAHCRAPGPGLGNLFPFASWAKQKKKYIHIHTDTGIY